MLYHVDLVVMVSEYNPSFKIKIFSSHSFSREVLQIITKAERICLDPCCVSLRMFIFFQHFIQLGQ